MLERSAISHCPICAAAAEPLGIDISYGLACFGQRVAVSYSVCPSCGFVFQSNPLTRKDLATYYRASPRYRSAAHNSAENALHLAQVEFMRKGGLRDGSAVLDIGADMGKLLDLVKESCNATTAYIEDSELAAAHINAHGRHRQIVELVGDDRFDWIVLSQVLEHIVDPVSFMRALRPHLCPDGRVFIEVPCQSYWDPNEGYFSFEHVNYFSPAALASALQAAGFITLHSDVCTDRRYSQGNVRIIRSVVQLLPNAGLSYADAAKRHFRRGMADRFELVRMLARRHKNNGKIALYGAAELADLVMNNTDLGADEISAIFDTDTAKHGKIFHGLPIYPPT